MMKNIYMDRIWKGRLGYLLRFVAVIFGSFLLGKGLFVLYNHKLSGTMSLGDFLGVLFHGASLDLAVVGYLIALPLLVVLVSYAFTSFPARRVLLAYHLLISAVLALVFVGDTALYPFWGFKLDGTVFLYLDSPKNAFASVPLGFTLLGGLIAQLWAFGLFTLLQKSTPRRWERGSRPILGAVGVLALLPLTVLVIRGGLGRSVTNVGQVYFSQNQFLNHAAVNPVFSLFSSLDKAEDYDAEYNFFSEQERAQLVAGLYPKEAPAEVELLRTQRPNIVLIILESFGAKYIESFGGMPDITPNLDRLAREGVVFSQCYANSYRTDRGVLSTLSGYPSFPTHSVMKMPAKSRTLSGIAQELQRVGYATDFLYGGDANFTNMKGYLLGSGYERVTDDRDLDRSLPRQSWGVQDGATFDYLYRAIQQRGTDRPWHTGFLTLSSHEPFIVPYQRFAEEVPNAFSYVDDCIGQFADRLRKTKAWDNLLVICVADHGYSTGPSKERHTSRIHHIPMLWFGGAIKEPRRIDQLMTQSDLAATLLAQLGLSYRDFPFSRNILAANYTYPFAYYTFNDGFGFIDSTGITVMENVGEQLLEQHPSPSAERIARGRALLQTTHDDLARQ